LSPEIYLYASPSVQSECVPVHLKDHTKFEPIFNLRNSLKSKTEYNDLASQASVNKIVDYFIDERNPQNWLFNQNKQNSSLNVGNKNSVHKIVCTPNFTPSQVKHPSPWHKDLDNVIFTVGSDMNIRYWNITQEKYHHIYNIDGMRRRYQMIESDYLLIREGLKENMEKNNLSKSIYESKEGQKVSRGFDPLKHAGHRDRINDLLVLEKNEMIVTCSRDKTIKVWK